MKEHLHLDMKYQEQTTNYVGEKICKHDNSSYKFVQLALIDSNGEMLIFNIS